MQTRIQKWGNSLALRIPKSFAVESHLDANTLVDVSMQDGKLVITPVEAEATLESLLAQITPENLHGAEDTGVSLGREAW